MGKQLDDKAQARIEKISGGIPIADLGKGLIAALDLDAIVQAALATAKAKGITRSEDTLLPEEIESARLMRVAAACAPFDKPELRDEIENTRREREQIIDHINLDHPAHAHHVRLRPRQIAAFGQQTWAHPSMARKSSACRNWARTSSPSSPNSSKPSAPNSSR